MPSRCRLRGEDRPVLPLPGTPDHVVRIREQLNDVRCSWQSTIDVTDNPPGGDNRGDGVTSPSSLIPLARPLLVYRFLVLGPWTYALLCIMLYAPRRKGSSHWPRRDWSQRLRCTYRETKNTSSPSFSHLSWCSGLLVRTSERLPVAIRLLLARFKIPHRGAGYTKRNTEQNTCSFVQI